MPPPPVSIFLLLTLFFSFGASHPGSILPPMEVAKEVYERFTKAINSGNNEEVKKFFIPCFLATGEGYQLANTLAQEVGGYSYSVEYAFYKLVPGPERNVFTINSTIFFRGPHPDYNRKNYEVVMENTFVNPQLEPHAWFIRTMIRKVYPQQKKRKFLLQNQMPNDIAANVLNEFFAAVNYQDIRRLENVVDIKERISPTGMQQLRDLLVFNVFEVRSARFFNDEIRATIVTTNQSTRVKVLFWFAFKNRKEDRMWRISDMKLMFNEYGPPENFIDIL
ncbi:unnamed protein product [Caenorhabditis brenneri]